MQKHQDEKIAEKMASQTAATSNNPSSIMKPRQQTSPSQDGKFDITSPVHHRAPPTQSPIISSSSPSPIRKISKNAFSSSVSSSEESNLKIKSPLGATVIFSNSDVDLDDIGILNSKAIEQVVEDKIQALDESLVRHGSEPDLANLPAESSSDEEESPPVLHRRRSHKRSESEPFIQLDSTTDRL
jgi:hypothetical protein